MNTWTRRDFAKTLAVAGAATALGQTRVLGANDRLRLGFIGLGNRGDQVLDAFLAHKDADVVAIDLDESTADGEEVGLTALRHPQFAVRDLGEQRNVAGQNADFALGRWEDDGVDRVGKNPGLGRDDFERERHGGQAFFEAARTSSMPPFM